MSATLPAGIKSTKQLFWYKDTESRHYPCRVCERVEARIHLNLEPFWDDDEACLVQVLDFPPSKPFRQQDRVVVNRPLLIPYHGIRYTKEEWSRSIFSKYINERRQEAKQKAMLVIQSDLDATYLYLERILKAAKEVEENDEILSEDDTIDHLQDESDLEVPYDENLELDGEFHRQDFSEKKIEPLRPGDVILYTCPIFVSGDRRGRRQATVLSTDPHREPMLVLDTGEFLPENCIIQRIKVLEKGKLHPHRGCARRLEKFILKKRALQGDFSLRAGMMEEAERIGLIVDKNTNTFQERAEADGFAPMDLLNNFGQHSRSSVIKSNPHKIDRSQESDGTAKKTHKKPLLLMNWSVTSSESQKVWPNTKQGTKPRRSKGWESNISSGSDTDELVFRRKQVNVEKATKQVQKTKNRKDAGITDAVSSSRKVFNTIHGFRSIPLQPPHHTGDSDRFADTKRRRRLEMVSPIHNINPKKSSQDLVARHFNGLHRQEKSLVVISSIVKSKPPTRFASNHSGGSKGKSYSNSTLESLKRASERGAQMTRIDRMVVLSKNESPTHSITAPFSFTKQNTANATI